jgi:hypothetical protein
MDRETMEAKAPREPFDDPPRIYCEHCEWREISERQARSDEPWCDDCRDDLAQQQAEDRAAEPPVTMDEMHRAAWRQKQGMR